MSNFLQLIAEIAIILLAAKAAGYLSTRLKQPSVFGELLVGVLLGPSLLDITHMGFITDTHLGEIIYELGEIGVLLLMFLAGLELHIKDLSRNTRVALLAGVLGVVFPVGLGILFGQVLDIPFSHALFLGLTLGATSVSISAQVLIELQVLRTRVGLGLLGAAVFDDILVILILSSAIAFLSSGGSFADILWVFAKMVIFLALATAVGLWLLPRVVRFTRRLNISQGLTTLALVILLGYGLAAELMGGMAAITGTFLAGLMFARTPEKSTIETSLVSIAYAFFVPIFFVSIGLGVNLRELNVDSIWVFLGISAIAILGKIIGSGAGALLARFTPRESLQIGIGMVSRGEVGLIIANIGAKAGYLDEELLTIIVGMILVTTLVTPPMLRASFRSPKKTDNEPSTPPETGIKESV
ncbi:MAG TPA: cation:proton antiporter [Anaerolineaceae bacterium]|nr:cation:proton antiporter [Anaerolineaceae bacterium]